MTDEAGSYKIIADIEVSTIPAIDHLNQYG